MPHITENIKLPDLLSVTNYTETAIIVQRLTKDAAKHIWWRHG